MAQELGPETVFLHMPVKSIDQSHSKHCLVQTDGGPTFECQRVIFSVPTTLYYKTAFNPPCRKGKLP